jgi:hypothetical protein
VTSKEPVRWCPPVTEQELEAPRLMTALRIICHSVRRLWRDPIGQLLGSAFILIMLWGTHGTLDLLGTLWHNWRPGVDRGGQGTLIPGLPWDQEWVSFFIGAVLLIGIPSLLIRRVFKQRLSDYGLCLPPRDRRAFAWLAAATLFVASLVPFYIGARDPGMRAVYPLYRGGFSTSTQFLAFETGYLVFFFVIEFVFRGWLLFGLFRFKDEQAPGIGGERGPLVFGYYAILISMLSYTAWHLGKPLPELWGTIVWGIAAGSVVLASRSIIPVTLAHWLLNVFLDFLIWRRP